MRRILFRRILMFLLCVLFTAGCAATKTTTKPATPSPPPKPAAQAESRPESRPATPPKAPPEILYVTADQVNLRACPSAKCKTTAVLKSGEALVKLGQKEDWTIVRVKATRLEGWVASHLVGKTPSKKKPVSKSKEASPPPKKAKPGPSDLQEEFSP